MVAKSVLIAGLTCLGISLPVTVPVMVGQTVTFAAGPAEISYTQTDGFEFDLTPVCGIQECPILEVRVGDSEQTLYRIGF